MPRLPTALLLLAVAAVYWPALLGDYVYDDTILIAKNTAVARFDLGALLTAPLFGGEQPYWRPLTTLLFAVGHQLGGATGVHALALLLHAINTLLVQHLAQRWLRPATTQAWTPFWIALLFAVHPVQVEAVSWCAAINDPLWVCCALLAIVSLGRWRDARTTRAPWLVAGLCLLALLSKENALAALPLLWCIARCEPQPAPPRGLLPALAAALATWLLLRALVFGSWSGGLLLGPEQPSLTAIEALAPCELLLRHLGLLAAPLWCSPFHSFEPTWPSVLSATAIVLAGALLLGRWRSRQSCATRIAGALLLLPLLLPLLHWRGLGAHPIGERYLYLPTFGFSLLLVAQAQRLRTALSHTALALLALTFAGLAFVQTGIWRDQAHLVQHGTHTAPGDGKVQVMAGALALQAAQTGDRDALARAGEHYASAERAAAARGDAANRQLSEARLGLAWCLSLARSQGARIDGKRVMLAFQQAVDTDPHNAAAWIGLGVAHGMAEEHNAAQQAFERGLQLDPDNSEGWCNLGFLQLRRGQRDAARASLQRSLACDPRNARAAELLAELR